MASFLDFFNDLWKPYDEESKKIKQFYAERSHGENKPSQYGAGDINSNTFDYNLDSLCSFQIKRLISSGDSSTDYTVEGFSLFPNPERIQLSEPTRNEITITQFGSKIVERGGMVTKNLSIGGNFGYFPGRTKVAPKGKLPRDGFGSGLFFLQLWIGFFRFYEELVSLNQEGHKYFLVFNDYVKQESWIVEPNEVSTEQDVSKKFTHPYNWSFTTLAPYNPVVVPKKKSLWDNVVDFAGNIEEALASFERFSGRLEKFILDFTDSVLTPVNSLVSAIGSVVNGTQTILGIPKATIASIESTLVDLQIALDTSTDDDGYPLEIDSAYATQILRQQITKVLNTPEFFNEESNYASNDGATLYEPPTFNSETGELMESGANAPVLGTEKVQDGDTVQTISKRVFGTYSGWEEIVAINKLRPPYIASQTDIDTLGLKNVLAYGDTFTYTKNGKFSQKDTDLTKRGPVSIVNETGLTKKMSEHERALGTDIYLNNDGDIEFINNDFKIVSGYENIKQQIKTKFSIEKGKLRSAEYIGITKTIGKDRSAISFQVAQDIQNMVKIDERFSNASVNSESVADKLTTKAEISLSNLNEAIPVTIKKDFA